MAQGVNDNRPQIVRASDEHAAKAPLAGPVGLLRGRSARREASPHSAKFKAATVGLAGIGIAAIVAIVLILSSGTKTQQQASWSSWSPPDSGLLGARDIADHVAPYYRLSATEQLSVVTVVNLGNPSDVNQTTGAPIGLQVAVRPDPTSSAVSLLTGNTIAYNLCGVQGPGCQLGGTPSSARLLLLRREALELALYTFKYVSSTDNVVAILPPGYTSTGCTGICPAPDTKTKTTPVDIAVLFVKPELQPWLDQPLSDTLPEQFPPTVEQMPTAPEAGLVDQITARGLFSEKLVQAQDGSSLLQLSPLPPQ